MTREQKKACCKYIQNHKLFAEFISSVKTGVGMATHTMRGDYPNGLYDAIGRYSTITKVSGSDWMYKWVPEMKNIFVAFIASVKKQPDNERR